MVEQGIKILGLLKTCWSYWEVPTLNFQCTAQSLWARALFMFMMCITDFLKSIIIFCVRLKLEILHHYLKRLLLERKNVFSLKNQSSFHLLCFLYTTYFKYIWLKNTNLQAVPWIFIFLVASFLGLSAGSSAVSGKLLKPSLAKHFDFI